MTATELEKLDLSTVQTRLVEEKDFDFVLNGRTDIFLIEDDHSFWESELERNETIQALHEDIRLKQVLIAERPKKSSSAVDGDCTSDEMEYVGFVGVVCSNKVPFGVNYGEMEKPITWISSSWVVPKFRGSGVGRYLYKAAEEHAISKGITEVWCDVYMCNPSSRSFHEKLGFQPHVMIYRKELKSESVEDSSML